MPNRHADSATQSQTWSTPKLGLAEPAALTHPTWVHLKGSGALGLDGPDALSFLQGYVTCDLADLGPDRALPGAFTNLQGRVLADFLAVRWQQMPVLLLSAALIPALQQHLQKYLLFAKSKLVDLSPTLTQLGVLHPPQTQTLPPGQVTPWPEGGLCIQEPGCLPRQRLLLPDTLAQQHWQQVQPQTAPMDLWTLVDIDSGRVSLDPATSAEFLPQMLGLVAQGAVSFSKGCYLGQEIVARAQHRGQVKRGLRRIPWQGTTPQPGQQVADDAGICINAAACAPGLGRALVVTRLEAASQSDANQTT